MHSGDIVTCNVTISGAGITKATEYTVVDTNYLADASIADNKASSQQGGLMFVTIKNDNGALTVVPSTMVTTKGEAPNL